MKRLGWLVMAVVTIVGCAGPRKAEIRPLHAPTGTSAAVSQQLEQGNQWPTSSWRKRTII